MKKNARKLRLNKETLHALQDTLKDVQGGLVAPNQGSNYYYTVYYGPRYTETCSCNCSYSICEIC